MNNPKQKPVLSCQNLTVGYKDKPVLAKLNLAFEAGHFIALLGPNGAGKTTLLRTLSRHLNPLAGRIEVAGRPLSELSASQLARQMAVVLTEKVSPPLFTVYEFVALGRYPYTDFLGRLSTEDHQVVANALSAVHAADLAGRTFTDLSDGERQKALVARALAQQPRLLLLDEPTMHLDLKHRMEVMGILRNLCRSREITVVASLHDVDVAAKVSDRVALIKDGGITSWGPPETVLTGQSVSRLYDFSQAEFNSDLGGIEMRGDEEKGRIFVVAGMGSGARIFRLLAKKGFSIATGVLHTNDLDCYVARSIGADLTSQSPMEPVNGASLSRAKESLHGCMALVDCGFEIGPMNAGNLDLLRAASDSDIPIFSLRKAEMEDVKQLSLKTRVIHCQDAGRLIEDLNF